MHKIKTLIFIKLLLLIGAMILAGFLLFLPKSPALVEESTIIIMDVSFGMMTQDIPTGKGDLITRLDAAKNIVTKIVSEFSQRSFGLITYEPTIDYLIPSTFDSGTLLQYANSLVVQSAESRVQNVGTKNTQTLGTLNSESGTHYGVQSAESRVQSGSQNSKFGTNLGTIHSEPGTHWSTGLVAALQDKDIIILGNVQLPKSLEKNAQIIPLETYKNLTTHYSLLTTHRQSVSNIQAQRLVLLLCLLTILAL